MFAGDVLRYITDSERTLREIQKNLQEFGTLSGFKVNYNKSKILQINNPTKALGPKNIFLKANDHIKYIGIKIGKTPSSIFNLNFPPLIDKIARDLTQWKNLPLSLFGRAHLFKMNCFAKLLYPLQLIPILINNKDVQRLNKVLTYFL